MPPPARAAVATQAAIREITETLCRLLAPIARLHGGRGLGASSAMTDSVHMELFPQPNPAFPGSDASVAVE